MLQERRRQLMRFALVTAGLVLLLFFLCPPDSLVYAWFWKPVIRRGTYIAIAICFALYFWKVRIDVFGLLAIAYWLVMMLSTLLMDASLWVCARTYLPMVASMLLVRALFGTCKKQLLWAVLIVSVSYLLINLVGMLAFPSGTKMWHTNWYSGLLGNRNGFPRFFVAAIGSSVLIDAGQGRRCSLRTVMIVPLCLAQSWVAPSATGEVAFVLLIVLLLAVQKRAVRKMLNIGVYAATYIIVFLSIVVLRLQFVFEPFIAGVLHKDLSFSGRVQIWDAIFGLMGDPAHLLIGYCGNPSPIVSYDPRITTGHNAILDVLYNGGIIGLVFALAICIVVGRGLFFSRQKYETALVSACLGAFLVLGVTEHVTCVPLCIFMALGFCVGRNGAIGDLVGRSGGSCLTDTFCRRRC
ncbi:hypothetical protein DMP11_03205 [Parvibacter caecicola]|nr:hypothetical protein DMP11_03205 [Parvibacter caecicola]